MTKTNNKKSKLGQFFTTNYKYILQNLYIPENTKHIIEPFAGNCDLLSFIENKEKYIIECYDIDPKKECVIERDTLLDPPNYDEKFIITNPPYLARNKCQSKVLYDKYDANDLYKCLIKQLINSKCHGGILIIPLNFWCSIRKSDIQLRKDFLQKYNIVKLNIFEERVFDDTSYTICSFQFAQNYHINKNEHILNIDIYPTKTSYKFLLDEKNNYTVGGEIYNLPQQNLYKITRLLEGGTPNTNILAKCIDDNVNNKIQLKMVNDNEIFYDDTPNNSARTYATLVIKPELSIEQQEHLVKKFNDYITKMREKYHSLFLTNYRESKSIARKRISFDLLYNIISYLLVDSTTNC